MLRKIMNRLLFPNTCDNEHFVSYLRRGGAYIGANTRFIDPKRCSVDPGRLDYIHIGDNCCLSVCALIAHDYSWYILQEAYNEMLPDPGAKISIGNNCFIGYQACILKGTTIGDNVIIGARSVVKGNIPSNTVWAGSPARCICTLDEYIVKKKKAKVSDALYRRDHIENVHKRKPTIEDMGFFSFLFLERNQNNYDKYIKQLEFNGCVASEIVRKAFFNSTPTFSSFEEFLYYNSEQGER